MSNQFNKKRILFVVPEQFGYVAGYYYYCKYLIENGFKVSVLSVDSGKAKIKIEDPEFTAYYIKSKGKFYYRWQLLIELFFLRKEYDVIILKYFYSVFLSQLFLRNKKVFLDIRTGSVRTKKYIRTIDDLVLRFETLFFNKVLILSLHLAKKLKLPKQKVILLPLGADDLSQTSKDYVKSMNLLYIGTFFGRRLEDCIIGFSKFKAKYSSKISLSFDIIGTGQDIDKLKIEQAIIENKLKNDVSMHGELSHHEAMRIFKKCNYGISYVPMTDFYNLQPPTKTFEYVLSGMVCIGTNTYANKELINKDNGMLCDDNPTAFYNALKAVFVNRYNYQTDIIKGTLKDYSWKNIVQSVLIKNI